MAGTGCALLFTQGSKGKTSLTAQGEWTVEDKNKAPLYMLSVGPILQYSDSCHSDDSEWGTFEINLFFLSLSLL